MSEFYRPINGKEHYPKNGLILFGDVVDPYNILMDFYSTPIPSCKRLAIGAGWVNTIILTKSRPLALKPPPPF